MSLTGTAVSSSASSTWACRPCSARAGGGRDDAEARHRLGEQVGELETGAGGLADGFLGAGELDGLGDDVRAVELAAELGGGDVVGGVLRALVDLPANQFGAGAGGGVISLAASTSPIRRPRPDRG